MNIKSDSRKKVIAATIASFIFSLTELCPFSSLADDLPRTDPDRKAILDAARRPDLEYFPGEKFIVKSLVKDGDWAYLCALIEENGYKDSEGHLHKSHGIQGTDDDLNVSQIFLNRKNGYWKIMYETGSLASTEHDVDCKVYNGKIIRTIRNSDDIKEFLSSLPSDSHQ